MPERKDTADLAISSNDQAKNIFKLKYQIELNGQCNSVRSVRLTSDNRYLIITYEISIPRIRVVDLDKLEFLSHQFADHTDTVRMTCITKDNKAFYTASWDGSSRRFEIESGKCTQILRCPGRIPNCILDSEQKFLFTASYDCDIESKNTGRCWDLSSGKIVKVYRNNDERIFIEGNDITYNDGKVYTGGDEGCAYQWNINDEKPLLKYFSFQGSVRKMALSANYFAAACTDGLVRVHDKLSGEYYRYFSHAYRPVRDVCISKDETKLWSAIDDGSVSCFNLTSGELIYNRKIHDSCIWSMCLRCDEKIMITGSRDGSVVFLSADSGQILARLYNLQDKKDFLITCPPDKIFPDGFFYTTNKNFIQVFIEDKEKGIQEKLNLSDPRRDAYINKLNLRNLIITRLKSNEKYTSLTERYTRNQKMIDLINTRKFPHLLKP